MKVTLRPYRKTDAKGFLGLVRDLARFEKLKPPTPAAERRLLRDAGKRFKVLMAMAGRKPVGYAITFHIYSSFRGRPTLYLEDIYVDPGFRGAGIGRRIFDRLLRQARRERCGRVEWQVLKWNRKAKKFYRKLGARMMSDWVTCRVSLP